MLVWHILNRFTWFHLCFSHNFLTEFRDSQNKLKRFTQKNQATFVFLNQHVSFIFKWSDYKLFIGIGYIAFYLYKCLFIEWSKKSGMEVERGILIKRKHEYTVKYHKPIDRVEYDYVTLQCKRLLFFDIILSPTSG